MDLLPFLRQQTRSNRLANLRLHTAMRALPDAEFYAARTGFFPSLAGTLNHILDVDGYYLAALAGDTRASRVWEAFVPHATLTGLAAAQAGADERFIALLDAATAAQLDAVVALDRGDRVQHERFGHVVAHLLAHQVHHRGRAHAMLSGTALKPPQFDEFLMPSEARFRTPEMAAPGWTEAALFGGLLPNP